MQAKMATISVHLRQLHEFIMEFPNGIGDQTLKELFRKRYPQYAGDTADINNLIEHMKKSKFIKTGISNYQSHVYYAEEPAIVDNVELHPSIKELGISSPIHEMQPIYVGGNSAFFARYSKESKIVCEKLFAHYNKDGKKDLKGEIKLNSYYAVYDKTADKYQRVRVDDFDEAEQKYGCILIDDGGHVYVEARELIDLPSSVKEISPCAIFCMIDIKDKLVGFPRSRRALQIALSGIDSTNQRIPDSVNAVKIQFLAYIKMSHCFVVRLFADDGATNLLEQLVKNTPEIALIDRFYRDNMEEGNYFGNYDDPIEEAKKLGIELKLH